MKKPVARICWRDNKRCYDKKGAITARNKRYEEDRVKLRIYPCHDHWHLTKILRGEWQGRKKDMVVKHKKIKGFHRERV